MSNIREIERQMTESEGWRIRSEIEALHQSYQVFLGNDKELLEIVRLFGDPRLRPMLWPESQRATLDAFLQEITRKLHNYLAAAGSLRDHARALIKREYPIGAALRTAYDERIAELFDTPGTHFIQDLRNYTLHNRLPPPVAQFTIRRMKDPPPPGAPEAPDTWDSDSRVMLSAEALARWDKWSTTARLYLEDHADGIPLADAVSEYSAAVNGLYTWLGPQQAEAHRKAMADLDQMRDRLRAAFVAAGLGDYLDSVDERLARDRNMKQRSTTTIRTENGQSD